MAQRYTNDKVYIEFRIIVDPLSNQDALQEAAEALKDLLYDTTEEQDCPIKGLVKDVTYEIVHEVTEEK